MSEEKRVFELCCGWHEHEFDTFGCVVCGEVSEFWWESEFREDLLEIRWEVFGESLMGASKKNQRKKSFEFLFVLWIKGRIFVCVGEREDLERRREKS